MTWPQYLMLAAAVLSALAWRWNATSAALAFSYFATQVWWLVDPGLGAGDMFMLDVVTIALVFCKAASHCPDQDFATGWEHVRCFLAAPSRGDRIVLACFPLMWIAYAARADELTRWWILYGLAMIQFAAAGADAFSEWRKARTAAGGRDTPSSGLMRVAWESGVGT